MANVCHGPHCFFVRMCAFAIRCVCVTRALTFCTVSLMKVFLMSVPNATCFSLPPVHGARTCEPNIKFVIPIMSYLVESGTCPECKTNYVTRWRCFKHVSDMRPRRDKCAQAFLSGDYARVEQDEVDRLDESFRQEVRASCKDGYTLPLASGRAKTLDGKTIGHVTR